MNARLNLTEDPVVAKALKYFGSAGRTLISESNLPKTTQNLVMLRASQINGCGWCTDIHSKEAAHAGESAERLNLVAAWRESTVFTDAERAALELAEQGTRIADAAGGVTDLAWSEAAEHFDAADLAALVALIALINASNRMGVINAQKGGSYQIGDFE